MDKKKIKARLSFFVKLALTSAALFFVFKKIDVKEFGRAIRGVKIHYFLLAFVVFNASKAVAAVRLNHFFEAAGLKLSAKYNLILYYVGMFYNVFLPGSIGGDGYKVYLLRQAHDVKTKDLIWATLLDRASGLALLFFLASIFTLFSTFAVKVEHMRVYSIAVMAAALPGFYVFIKKAFPRFSGKFLVTTHLSLWVQIGQVICSILLLLSLSVDNHYMDYLSLFMLSSVVAVLPISIGGVGAREMVFLYGFRYLCIDQATAIAFTMMFFAVTASTAVVGLFFLYAIDKTEKERASANG